ncbi:hypothetical protein BDV97DRAFT_290489 [Delphinella strobiligena]|nr:hypothetical protein BDV97DRAFT_290489 [Delphinella strobiligena]
MAKNETTARCPVHSGSEASVGEEVEQSDVAGPRHTDYQAGSASGDIGLQKGDNYGVRVLYDPPAQAIVDIVFLHGLTGNAYTTWLHGGTNVHWPSACLKNAIPDARIISFGYDADIAHWWRQASTSRLHNHAEDLVVRLVHCRQATQTEDRKIIFVAHSLGGLVVETAIITSRHSHIPRDKQIEENTVGIMLMGTPHLGAGPAEWATFFTNVVKLVSPANVNIVQVLKPDSEVLQQIQKDFYGILLQRREAQEPIEIFCFYETLPVRGVGEIVPSRSAILAGYRGLGIHSDHRGMTKFAGPDDQGYRDVVGAILPPVKVIRQAKEALLSTQTGSG